MANNKTLPNIDIRLIREEDIELFKSLDNNFIIDHDPLFFQTNNPLRTKPDKKTNINAIFQYYIGCQDNKTAHIIIAIFNDKIIGLVGMRLRGNRASHTADIFLDVNKPYQNMGLGSKMLAEIEKVARLNKCKVLIYDICKPNKYGADMLHRNKFKKAGSIPNGILKKDKKGYVPLDTYYKEL